MLARQRFVTVFRHARQDTVKARRLGISLPLSPSPRLANRHRDGTLPKAATGVERSGSDCGDTEACGVQEKDHNRTLNVGRRDQRRACDEEPGDDSQEWEAQDRTRKKEHPLPYRVPRQSMKQPVRHVPEGHRSPTAPMYYANQSRPPLTPVPKMTPFLAQEQVQIGNALRS